MENILMLPQNFLTFNVMKNEFMYNRRLDRLAELNNNYQEQSKQISIATKKFEESSLTQVERMQKAESVFYKNEEKYTLAKEAYEQAKTLLNGESLKITYDLKEKSYLELLQVLLDNINLNINYLEDSTYKMSLLLNIAKEAKSLTDEEMLANNNLNNQFFITNVKLRSLYCDMERIEIKLEKFTTAKENIEANILNHQRKILSKNK